MLRKSKMFTNVVGLVAVASLNGVEIRNVY